MNGKTVLVILSAMLVLVLGLSSCIISPHDPTPSSPSILSLTQVPNTPLDLYIYAKQDKPSVIPAEMVGVPCDIEVESCAIWGVPVGDDFALGMGLTLTTADCASKLYAAINFQEYGWKMLSGSTIYFVYGSGTAAETLKKAIANHNFKYYDDTESLKAVADLPNSGTTRPAAIGIAKPSKALLGFIANIAKNEVDPRDFDQVNTMLNQANLKLIAVGLYSPSHIDIAKIVENTWEIIEGGGSISNLNLCLLISVESNHPSFLVETAVSKFLIDSGFTEMNFAGFTIYKGALDMYGSEAIPALVWIKGNRVFAAGAGQESYAQSLISSTIARASSSPTPPAPSQNYTLSTSVSPPGGGSIFPSGGQYNLNTQIALTATPAAGYTFSHWSGSSSSSSSTTTITMDSNKGVTAHFTAITSPTPPAPPAPPEYHTLTFELAKEGERYIYSFPIYVRNNQTLHYTWRIVEGEFAYCGFQTPKGSYFCFHSGGDVASPGWATGVTITCGPSLGGTIEICPFKMKEYTYDSCVSGGSCEKVTMAWGEGYYLFDVHGYVKTKIKVDYWIED